MGALASGLVAEAVLSRSLAVVALLAAVAMLMWVSGVIAGVAGVGGGFLKTPVTSDLMGIPLRVAASTTTFTIGVTASAGLVVFAAQGRIEPQGGAAVIVGSLLGGQAGARLQALVPAPVMRVALGVVLVVVAGLLVTPA